ncbi:hypothetical protein B0O95_13013 [Mycetohabitans endofungorum]|uniref:Uncharacterized protein n=1 Tax=Mycetohabitans endofungorum TaxID=417203 RepID=A0A2P5K6K3_9BURK|nr:hypothetical protein B0O95_13013 [Mycetohabitans endofungorum]
MTRGRKKWRVRQAFEPSRHAQEQLQKAYEQLSPIETRSTVQSCAGRSATSNQASLKRGRQ